MQARPRSSLDCSALPPRRKHARVTLRNDLILVETISYSGYLGVSNGPARWLAASVSCLELGRAVYEAMNSSRGLPLDFEPHSQEFESKVFSGTPFKGWSNCALYIGDAGTRTNRLHAYAQSNTETKGPTLSSREGYP